MTPTEIDEKLERLASIMRDTPREVGVAMGFELYRECQRRDLLQMEVFSWLGTGFMPNRLPTYRGTHFAFVHPEFSDWEFQVGTPRA